jgi:RNase adapter protein RapZ
VDGIGRFYEEEGSAERVPTRPRVVMLTGLSGAGKSLAIRSLEDLGFYCVDNLPADLIGAFADLGSAAGRRRLAVVTDARGGQVEGLSDALDSLEERGIPYLLLFLEAREDVLVQRYKETRRRHPMAPEGRVLDGIRQERELLAELRGRAHRIIDTTTLGPADLRQEIAGLFTGDPDTPALVVTITSFGFKHGLPSDADLVFDVRFLPNPHYEPDLSALPGTDRRVAAFVLGQAETRTFLAHLEPFLAYLLPRFVDEGKEQLMIAIGCTGGRHRSVALSEHLATVLRESGYPVAVQHRDLRRAEAHGD